MLRYDRQIKPGLVALYDIWPGNGAGLFLQPQSPHGAFNSNNFATSAALVDVHALLSFAGFLRAQLALSNQ